VTAVTDGRSPSCDTGRMRTAPSSMYRRRFERTGMEDTMNILLWYLPYAMFTETCDLVISECKVQPDSKQTDARTRRPAAQVAPRQR
jgi:hypothetical protein